jgi:Na+/melibiose symporter-like transporter
MQGMGYVNNAKPDASGKFTEIDVTLLSWDFALELRSLVAIMFLIAGIMLFIGLGLIYNLDKKTLAKMNEELAARHEAEAISE